MVDYQIERGEVYVVPNFISEGYFTREVIPRELELTGETTHVRGKTWHYCDPVGIHPRMTDLLLHRARETAPEVDPADAALFIVGHGTALNAKSTEAIREQVRLLREKQAPYAEILDAYMEEYPDDLFAGKLRSSAIQSRDIPAYFSKVDMRPFLHNTLGDVY